MAGDTRSYMKAILPIELVRKIDPSDSLSASTVLMLLYVMQYPDSTIKKLEQVTELRRSSASRHILILTERGDRARARPGLGLVTTYEDAQDSRVKRVKLTAKGQRLANDIAKIMET
ncbi:MAG: winged helix-turn-helix transcriptional regulator [Aestuariivirga sp.]|uniref:MarR family winged helix-turn-helix transcriptional regulator n=1 Tax=Aestuariivirga sp. TaxID=2650926 RepID=UPI0025C3C3FB|nr:MarR family winged helix-turn-helix transcriptional regulator [Aestuariivirga sp.]MCA3560532.1 winged helix-turn-helix transcriptional regulator [Aestuariivirga sp.]